MIKRSEKGSITLFTLIAMIFFLTIAFTAYTSAMIKLQAQNEDLERIKASYEQDLTEEGLASLYEELTTKKPYTVTFDANGGTVDLPRKEVKYGKEYGNLPVPTRDGYKFMGWNGKNMFNEEKLLMQINGTTIDGEYYVFSPFQARNIYGYGGGYRRLPIYNFKNNTQYTFSIYDHSTGGSLDILYDYSDGSIKSSVFSKQYDDIFSFSSHENNTIDKIRFSYYRNNLVYAKYIQLEEGSIATEYEPFYVTNNTKVTQKKDHVLTAIWEEN